VTFAWNLETAALVAFAAFALLDWFAVARRNQTLEYVAKPAALAFLIVWAATGENASPLLIAALCLGLLGDIYLMLPVDLFIPGLTAFLFGHFAYIADFEATIGWRLFWFVLLIAVTVPVARRIVGAVSDQGLRVAVVVYLGVITFMAASAFASGQLVGAAGAALFVISDAVLAWNRFVQPFDWARIAVIVTYHLGQLGLVAALR
jgi:uncharacterized membrane protein YhhN